MSDCVFCNIVAGKIPCTKVYENDSVLAFLDISPITRGHTIVIPKAHTKNIFTVSEKTLDSVMRIAQRIACAVGRMADGVNLGLNNERAAGQVVFHWHVHVIPRYTGDGLKHWPGGTLEKKDAVVIAKEIGDHLV